MTNAEYIKTVMTHTVNGKTFEVKTTNTGIFWGVFVDGQKYTDFMISERKCFRKSISETLNKLGAVGHTFRT